ncbi:hypothetical protein NFI96_004014 [Prochilodus magdalenae]|nr:hypothetical protein NFI96_004014 [Prochilodus magdalenae]
MRCGGMGVWCECVCVVPQNGSIILYNRKKVQYRKDGYCWKKRKDGKTTREDHMKLKVQGTEVQHPHTLRLTRSASHAVISQSLLINHTSLVVLIL